MLLSFEVSNFRSIRMKQEISFIASSLKDDGVDLIESEALPKEKILPAIVIYGANASGKSNVVKAFSSMLEAIRLSHRRGEPGGGVSRTPFLLDDACSTKPTTFEINFVLDGSRFNYGFEFSDDEYVAEWLYSYSSETGRRRKLYEREGQTFTFGRELKGRNQVIKDLTRTNSLFLSAAIQNGHAALSTIGEFFRSVSFETSLSLESHNATFRIGNEHSWNIGDNVIGFLNGLGTGASGYKVIDKTLSSDELEVQDKFKNAIGSVMKSIDEDFEFAESDINSKEIELGHLGVDGKKCYFPMHYESAGTLRLLSAMPKLFKALASGTAVIIDELDLSLHTKAAEAILALFASKDTNPKGAQLLATTHDTNLLQCSLLRRDQVWFTEKSEIGETIVYPLTDISTRRSDDIERGYLQGRYGAIPA